MEQKQSGAFIKILDHIIRDFRFRPIRKNLPKTMSSVLDIGCGPIPWFMSFDPKQFSKVQFTVLDKDNYIFEDENYAVTSIGSMLEKTLPFPDASFDCVTIFAVLEHLVYPEEISKEIKRVLKPGGSLLLTVPSPLAKPILEFLAFMLHVIDEESIRDHKRYLSAKKISELLLRAGFLDVNSYYFEFGCNVFARAISK
ncbi:MAG: class I SAM-dependent methyltransferase [Candidatus Paceibacterota bacterium]|jgi:ubiquinone/menaquinone biosynthesis C-methylase UbiE